MLLVQIQIQIPLVLTHLEVAVVLVQQLEELEVPRIILPLLHQLIVLRHHRCQAQRQLEAILLAPIRLVEVVVGR